VPPPDRARGSEEERPELASALLDLREKPPEPLAPSPQALGVWELAWPTMASLFTQTLVRWADIAMVGDLGTEAVAAVTGGGHLYWFIQSLVMAITTGLTALLARAVGAGDGRLADATLRQSLLLGAGVGVGLMAAGIPLRGAAMAFYGLEARVVELGSTYLLWLLVGNAPLILGFVFATALRAAGDSRTPLYVGIGANLVNLFLNWVLIYGHLGFPALGVAGAAIASSLAMAVQCVVFWWLWARRRLRRLLPGETGFGLDLGLWRRILHIGYPATLESALFSLGLLAFMRIMGVYGTAEFTAYNLGANILALSFLPGVGFATAAATLVGQHLGEGQPERARRSAWRATAGAVGSMSLLGAGVIAAADPVTRLFLDDPEVVPLTVDFVWILGVAQPLMAVEFALGGALRGAGDTRFPLAVVFVGLFVCRLTPAATAALAFAAPIQTVWSFLLLDYAVKAALLIARFTRGRWTQIEV
jgi:putative MATE family efflux protein